MSIKIAVAGLAHSHGTGYLKATVIQEGAEAVGFFDADNPRIAADTAEVFNAPVYENLDSLLKNSGAGAVLTAAVNAKKADIIVKAVEAGLHIISDKPLVTSLEDLDRVAAALERHKSVKLYLMLTERYNPVLVTAKALIEAGEIGEPVNIIAMRPHRLRPEGRPAWMFDRSLYGGILNDLSVHDIDIVSWLGGAPVDKILAACVSNKRFTQYADFRDNGEALLRLENGCAAFVLASWLTPEQYPHHGEMKFIVHGTRGQILADPQNNVVTLYSDTKKEHNAKIIKPSENYVTDSIRYLTEDGYTPAMDTERALHATRAALMCQQLAENGC